MTLAVFGIVFLMFLVGAYVGLVLPHYATKLVSKIEKNKELELILPTEVVESRLCTGRHDWIEALSINEHNEYVNVNVCKLCGFIPSKDLMATVEGLKRIIENNELRDLETVVSKEFEDKENVDITELLKEEMEKGLTYEKINKIYRAGQTSNKRYIIYKIARSEEIRRTKGTIHE